MSGCRDYASCLHCKRRIPEGALHVVVFSKALLERLGTVLANYYACASCVRAIPTAHMGDDEVLIFRATGPVEGGVHLASGAVTRGECVCSLTFENAVVCLGNEDLRRELTRSDRLKKASPAS